MIKFIIGSCCAIISLAGGAQKQSLSYDTLQQSSLYFNEKPFAALFLEDTGGHIFNTASLVGKTVYVDFWFTACAPCIKEIPFGKCLQQFFADDTNIVFLSICIENIDRKPVWKQMVRERELPGIHLFYARNKPQKVNLLREYDVTFPTYILINKKMKVVEYDAPRPSEAGLVQWIIAEAEHGKGLSLSFKKIAENAKEYTDYIDKNLPAIIECNSLSQMSGR